MKLACVYYKMSFKPKLEAGWFFSVIIRCTIDPQLPKTRFAWLFQVANSTQLKLVKMTDQILQEDYTPSGRWVQIKHWSLDRASLSISKPNHKG